MMAAYYMDIDIPAPPPSPVVLKDYLVKDIWSGKRWCSSIRKDYQRAVCVLWEDNSVTVEPVCNLIDFVNKVVCDKMIPILYNWKVSVEYKMCRSKLCVFCINERKYDDISCEECINNTKWLDIFINNEKIKRENIYINSKYIDEYSIVSIDPKIIKILIQNSRKRKHCEIEENLKMLDSRLMDISI
tara:strand:+ start:657 stop:1217 length:561 start_codon:yes stop_codon:yes gene_type:complete